MQDLLFAATDEKRLLLESGAFDRRFGDRVSGRAVEGEGCTERTDDGG